MSQKIVASNVATGALDAGGVTPAKLATSGFVSGSFTGRNASGACTLTGAVVGQRVFMLVRIDDSATALSTGQSAAFESTITVTNQIQQSSASDLSTQKFAIMLGSAAS